MTKLKQIIYGRRYSKPYDLLLQDGVLRRACERKEHDAQRAKKASELVNKYGPSALYIYSIEDNK